MPGWRKEPKRDRPLPQAALSPRGREKRWDVAAALDHLAGGAPGGAGRLRAMIGAEIYTVGDAVRISFRRLPRLELPGHRSFQHGHVPDGVSITRARATHQDVEGIYADQLADHVSGL